MVSFCCLVTDFYHLCAECLAECIHMKEYMYCKVYSPLSIVCSVLPPCTLLSCYEPVHVHVHGRHETSNSNKEQQTVYTLLMVGTHPFHLTNLCLSKPKSCCLADLATPHQHLAVHTTVQQPLKIDHPLKAPLQQELSLYSAQQSRAEGSLPVCWPNTELKYWKADVCTRSQTSCDALRGTE